MKFTISDYSLKPAKFALLAGILLSTCWGCGHPIDGDPSAPNTPPAPEATSQQPESPTTESSPTESTTEPKDKTAEKKSSVASSNVTTTANAPSSQETSAGKASQTIPPAPKGVQGSPMPTPSIVPNPSATPISFWKSNSEKMLRQGKANASTWEKFSESFCNYTFEAPLSWNIGSPKGFSNNSRLLWPAGTEANKPTNTRLMIVPWSIYDQSINEEIKKAEVSWFFSPELVQSATLTDQAQTKVGKYEAICNTYSVVPLSSGDSEATEMLLIATYVNAKPDCYAIIMATPQAKASTDMELYNKLLNSLSISAAPAPAQQAPPPDRAPQGNLLKPNMPLPSQTTEPKAAK